ncbi:phosphorylase [Alcaligenaceae bacterium]|nr:phosphorylase [Alcaligenaceae bacterium]
MTTALMQAVDLRSAEARASGALLPIVAEQTEIQEQGLAFMVRWISSLSAKDAAKMALPGGPRDPDFNPFLPPDPALTVGPVGEQHVIILNKFPVCDRHLVLARREFEEQLAPLTLADLTALAVVMSEAGGLGFYNGGAQAGASQRHKHVQWIPSAKGNASLRFLALGLPGGLPEHAVAVHPRLALKHVFVRVPGSEGAQVNTLALSLHRALGLAFRTLGLEPGENGLMPPFNMLIDNGWVLVVPRSSEHAHEVSVNALSYGGTLYVRHPEQVEAIRRAGPLAVLVQAAYS